MSSEKMAVLPAMKLPLAAKVIFAAAATVSVAAASVAGFGMIRGADPQSVTPAHHAQSVNRPASDHLQSQNPQSDVAQPQRPRMPSIEDFKNSALDVPVSCTYFSGEPQGRSKGTYAITFNNGEWKGGVEAPLTIRMEDILPISSGEKEGYLVHFTCNYANSNPASFIAVYDPELLVKGRFDRLSEEFSAELADYPLGSVQSLHFTDVSVDKDVLSFRMPEAAFNQDFCLGCATGEVEMTATWDGEFLTLVDHQFYLDGRELPRLNEEAVQRVVEAIHTGDDEYARARFVSESWKDWDAKINPRSTRHLSYRNYAFVDGAYVRRCTMIGSLMNTQAWFFNHLQGITEVHVDSGTQPGDYICPMYTPPTEGYHEESMQNILIVRPSVDGDVTIVRFLPQYG